MTQSRVCEMSPNRSSFGYRAVRRYTGRISANARRSPQIHAPRYAVRMNEPAP